ncbi:MAG: oligosaccharide flippase family protein [bacterium]|nr:oligosaccharide flippase family protein [bacterium]
MKKLFKEGSIYFLSTFLVNAGAYLLLPIYTKYLSPEQYGILSLVTVFGSIVATLMQMGLQGAVSRFYYDYKDDERELKSYISTIFYFLIGFNLLFLILLLLFGNNIFHIFIKNEAVSFYPFGFTVLFTTFFTLFSIVPLTLFRVRNQPFLYASFEIGRFVISAAFSIYFIVFANGLALGKLRGDFIGAVSLAVLFVTILILKKDIIFDFDYKKLKASLFYSFPLLPHLVLGMLVAGSDRIIIEKFRPLSDVGIYAIGYSLGSIMNVIVCSINSAQSPWFFETAKNHPDAKEVFRKFVTVYIIVVGGICLLGILYSKDIITYMLPPAYKNSSKIVPMILFAYLIQGLYYVVANSLFYAKKTVYFPFISAVSAAVNIGLNILLIPIFGITAAAVIFVLANVISFSATYVISRKAYPVDYEVKTNIYLLAIILSAIFCILINDTKIRISVSIMFLALFSYVSIKFINANWKLEALDTKISKLFNRG